MKLPVLVFCVAAIALAGCSAVGSLFADGDSQPPPADMANTYVPPAPVPDDFCVHVAVRAGQDAQAAGFDVATQDRMAAQSMQQCRSFTGRPAAAL